MINEMMPHWLAKRASLTPERIALQDDHEKMTFEELNLEARKMARQLAGLNIQDGDHIAVLLKNDFSSIILTHALTYLGAITVFLNTRLSPGELVFQIKKAQAEKLIYVSDYQEITKRIKEEQGSTNIRPGLEAISIKEVSELGESKASLRDKKENPLQTEIKLAKTHSIIFTSGTTGTPKGAILSYANHFWSAMGSCLNIGLEMKDSWLLALPIFHVSGLSILMRSVIYGIKIIVQEEFNAGKVNHYLIHEGVTHISVVSIQLQKMLEDLKENSYPKTLRCVLLGGGFVPNNLLEESSNKKIPVFQTYGMTETASQIVTLSPEYLTSKIGSAGKALFPAQLKIINEGQEVINQVGEIVVKGPSVTSGYYNDEKATKEALKEGWLYTGDLAYFDEDGFLYILDRRSDLIISGGENIYPAEIEAVLLEHPNVEEAGVSGLEDEKWGKVPIAFVKLRYNSDNDNIKDDELMSEEIKEYCASKLAKYKVPVKVICVDSLPRNASNKLIRRKLLEYFERNDYNGKYKK